MRATGFAVTSGSCLLSSESAGGPEKDPCTHARRFDIRLYTYRLQDVYIFTNALLLIIHVCLMAIIYIRRAQVHIQVNENVNIAKCLPHA